GFSFPSGTPTFTQLASGGGSWDASSPLVLNPTFTSLTTTVLAIQTSGSLIGKDYAGSSVSDNMGNTWYKIAEYYQQGFDSVGGNYFGGSVAAWICINPNVGSTNVTFTNACNLPTEGIASATAAIVDISGVGTISAVPTFKPLSDFFADLGVSSLNSMTGAINIIAGTGIQVTSGAGEIQIGLTGGGSGVSSLQGLVGALTIISPNGTIEIGTTSGDEITLEQSWYYQVENHGTPVTERPNLNFLAPLVATDNPSHNSTDISFTASSLYYQTVDSNGTPQTQEPALNFFTDFSLSDTSGVSTNVKIGAFTGDVTKPLGSLATTVIALQGNPITAGTPTTGYPLVWNGSDWVGEILPVAGGGTGTATPALVPGSGISISGAWPDQTVSVAAISGGTDYMDHGDPTWEYDSAYWNVRDDFVGSPSVSATAAAHPYGDFGFWLGSGSTANTGAVSTNVGTIFATFGSIPNPGQLILAPDHNQNNGTWLYPVSVISENSGSASVTGPQQVGWTLLDHAGWKMS